MASVVAARTRDFRAEIAEAYKRAALANGNMHRAVNALESIRTALAGRRTGLRALDAIDAEIARSEDPSLQEVLVGLRDELRQVVFEEQRAELEAVAADDPAAATLAWLGAYAAALSFWRLGVCTNVCEARVELGGGLPPREEFAHWTRLARDERWAEAYPMFIVLGERAELEHELRARFLVHAAEVQMYHLLDLDEAAALLDRAAVLFPDLPLLPVVRGELANERGETVAGEELLRSALETSEHHEACKRLGDAAKRAEDYAAAEHWFQAAVAAKPGEADSYVRLAWLHLARKGLADRGHLVSLIERAALVDPGAAYSAYVHLGDIFATGDDLAAAQEWFERAIALEPHRIRAFTVRAYAYGRKELYSEAGKAFARVIELAPESFDGYWGMAWLLERERRFEEAEDHYREALARRPAWRPTIEACVARMERQLGRHDEAERTALAALELAPFSAELATELHALVDELAERSGEPERALEILARIRALRGDEYEANYANRVGRVKYFHGDYAAAAEAFRRSLDANANDPVVWRNLGAAQRSLGEWDDAEQTIEHAREVDGDDAEYAAARALLLNARGNVAYDEARYEEARDLYAAASELTPDDAVIHSNRANACARLWRPGHRLEDLADARAALARALELDPDETYQSRHDMLEFEARLLEAAGEPWWDGEAPPRVLAIELASDLLPLVLAPGTRDLSADTHALIERFRARVRERIGLQAPGINFAEDESQWPGVYTVYLLEQPDVLGRMPTDGLVFPGDTAELERLGIEGEPLELAWSDTSAHTLDGEAAGAAEAAGLELWHPLEVPLRHLEHAIAEKLARVEAD